jgi:hypothetical protein
MKLKSNLNLFQIAFVLSIQVLFAMLCAVASVFIWNTLGFSYVLTFGPALALALMLRITTARITTTFKD